jgi:hypothetical protein
MQVLWWDSEVLKRAAEIFASEPLCVNIYTCMLPVDRAFDNSLTESSVDELPKIREYGLTDLGIYDLARWKSLGITFDNDEIEHGQRYLSQGFSVICHPWPTDAQIPWPAVVRNGVQQGREVNLVRQFLLRPLSQPEVESLKARNWTRLEDVCVPWGWTCLTPMWATDVNIDYLANRRQQLKRAGLLESIPRFQRSGLDNRSLRTFLVSQHRPSLWQLFAVAPARELRKRLKAGVRDSQ